MIVLLAAAWDRCFGEPRERWHSVVLIGRFLESMGKIVNRASTREVGVRVRDGSSFGMPRHIRISLQPPMATVLFLHELDRLTATTSLKERAQ